MFEVQSTNLVTPVTSNLTSLEQSVERSALALIAAGPKTDRKYLLQWNVRWGAFNLIGGKVDNTRGDDNSFIRAICREIEEEMGLKSPHDCYIVEELKHIYLRQYSHRDKFLKNYHFCVFAVDIFPGLPLNRSRQYTFARWLSTGRENIYVSAQEICQLKTRDNRPISLTTRHILHALNEISYGPESG
ncbi:MAG: NUDIX hydrolase [Ardenticatenaceae bacterium]|nr:NUDIX hydrolase [Anaerolineales bacterium]MCB8982449.1 NUDIX hydrolase [Ardenticatenaceae bacterium]